VKLLRFVEQTVQQVPLTGAPQLINRSAELKEIRDKLLAACKELDGQDGLVTGNSDFFDLSI